MLLDPTIVFVATLAQGIAALDYLAGKYLPMLKTIKIGKLPGWVLPIVVILSTALNITLYVQSRSAPLQFSNSPLVKIIGKTYVNERVPIDGFEYHQCVFRNVTLEYNGTSSLVFEGNHFFGFPHISSHSQAVSGTVVLLRGIGALRDEVQLVDKDWKPVTTINPPARQ